MGGNWEEGLLHTSKVSDRDASKEQASYHRLTAAEQQRGGGRRLCRFLEALQPLEKQHTSEAVSTENIVHISNLRHQKDWAPLHLAVPSRLLLSEFISEPSRHLADTAVSGIPGSMFFQSE